MSVADRRQDSFLSAYSAYPCKTRGNSGVLSSDYHYRVKKSLGKLIAFWHLLSESLQCRW